MSLWIDEKYLRLVSPQLERFTQKHPHVFNFRCPLCGDSEKIKSKARGYCFAKSNTLIFKCHNCSIALPFSALLKRVSRRLYEEYLLERVRENTPLPVDEKKTAPDVLVASPHVVLSDPLSYCVPLSDASIQSPSASLFPVYRYILNRVIPSDRMDRLYATNRAYTWLNSIVGEDKAAKVSDGEPYLVLPLTLKDGTWYGAQLRLLSRKEYITYKWSENETLKVFGLDKWSSAETTYIVEGPLDSLFVPNAIAACSSDLMGITHVMEARQIMDLRDARVFVWDSEPRNKEVVRLVRNAIRLGEQVVIWPKGFSKDINDAVMQGMPPEDVFALIRKRTYQGLRAELEFSSWLR